MMKITEIYDKYQIFEELRLHMLRTAAVAKNLCENWSGPEIDREEVISAMLLHDMGNMVKANLEKNIFGHSPAVIEKLKVIKADFMNKYGENDYLANEKIAKELGVSARVYYLIENLGFKKNYKTVLSSDFSLKLCAYSDQRVDPFGIVTLEKRLEEADKRYNGKFENEGGFSSAELVKFAFENEAQILRYTKLNLENLEQEIEDLKGWEVKLTEVIN